MKKILIWMMIVTTVMGMSYADTNPLYQKIDNLITKDKSLVVKFYDKLGELREYIENKLGMQTYINTKTTGVFDMKNIYGFNLKSLVGNIDFYISFFNKSMLGNSIDYTWAYKDYAYNTIRIGLGNGGEDNKSIWNIDIYEITGENLSILSNKYDDIVKGKIKVNSDSFLLDKSKNGAHFLSANYNAELNNLMSPKLIKDNQGNIKGISYYGFVSQSVPGTLVYQIISVKNKKILFIQKEVLNGDYEKDKKIIDYINSPEFITKTEKTLDKKSNTKTDVYYYDLDKLKSKLFDNQGNLTGTDGSEKFNQMTKFLENVVKNG